MPLGDNDVNKTLTTTKTPAKARTDSARQAQWDELQDAAIVMKGVLGEVDTTPLEWCEPLEKMIESLRGFRGLRDLLKTNFIEQGRKVKESAGGMFYDPSAMLAFIRFNFLLRRTLIELMHADLIAIRAGLAQLEQAGVRIIDCQHVGLSANEPLDKIK